MVESEVATDSSSRKRKRSRKKRSSRQEHIDLKSKRHRTRDAPEDVDAHSKNAGSKGGDHDSSSRRSEIGKPEESQELSAKSLLDKTETKKSNKNRTRANGETDKGLQVTEEVDTDNISEQPVALNEESGRGKWFVSGPVGGRILHLDPLFTNDEE